MAEEQGGRIKRLIDAQLGLQELLDRKDVSGLVGELWLVPQANDDCCFAGQSAELPADITRELARLALARVKAELDELTRAAVGELPRGADVTS